MTTNPNFKPSEGKREEFRKYLEKNGIMDALTKVLVSLYEEADKPDDALLYLLDKLATQAGLEPHKQLMAKLEEANEKTKSLEEELEKLKSKPNVGDGTEGETTDTSVKPAEIASVDAVPAASADTPAVSPSSGATPAKGSIDSAGQAPYAAQTASTTNN